MTLLEDISNFSLNILILQHEGHWSLDREQKALLTCLRSLCILWDSFSRYIVVKLNHLCKSMGSQVFVKYSHQCSIEEWKTSKESTEAIPLASTNNSKCLFFFHPKVLGLVSIKILIKSFRMIAKYFKCSLSALAVCKDFHFTDYFVQ